MKPRSTTLTLPLPVVCGLSPRNFVDPKNPKYKGARNEVHGTPQVYTPEDKVVQTPNSDTPAPQRDSINHKRQSRV